MIDTQVQGVLDLLNSQLHSRVDYALFSQIFDAVANIDVPQGYKLVPVQCPDPDFADMLFDELSKKAIGEFGDDLLIHFSDIDEEKIWALMVEAAKAQAVPDGFVLVERSKLLQIPDDT